MQRYDVNLFLREYLRVCKEIIWTLCCWPPGPLARRERRAIPGAVCEERATKPAGLRAAARRGAAALAPKCQLILARTLSFELPEEFRGVTCSSPQRLVRSQSGRDKVLQL